MKWRGRKHASDKRPEAAPPRQDHSLPSELATMCGSSAKTVAGRLPNFQKQEQEPLAAGVDLFLVRCGDGGGFRRPPDPAWSHALLWLVIRGSGFRCNRCTAESLHHGALQCNASLQGNR